MLGKSPTYDVLLFHFIVSELQNILAAVVFVMPQCEERQNV